jgi:hypothetical protein
MWDGDASSSPLGVLQRGEDGAFELDGTELRDDWSSLIRIEENVERGGGGRWGEVHYGVPGPSQIVHTYHFGWLGSDLIVEGHL